MVYLKSFSIPTQQEEEEYYEAHKRENPDMGYPFRILSALEFDDEIELGDVTIFHGGNGTGKSTLIKVIAAKLGLSPETLVESEAMERYISLCHEQSFEVNKWYDKDERDFNVLKDFIDGLIKCAVAVRILTATAINMIFVGYGSSSGRGTFLPVARTVGMGEFHARSWSLKSFASRAVMSGCCAEISLHSPRSSVRL